MRDDQRQIRVEIVSKAQNEAEAETLGELLIDDLPPEPRGSVRLQVRFVISTDGRLSIQAVELASGRRFAGELLSVSRGEQAIRVVDEWTEGSLPAPGSAA